MGYRAAPPPPHTIFVDLHLEAQDAELLTLQHTTQLGYHTSSSRSYSSQGEAREIGVGVERQGVPACTLPLLSAPPVNPIAQSFPFIQGAIVYPHHPAPLLGPG